MTRPYSTTVTAGDDILADQYNNLRLDAYYHFQGIQGTAWLDIDNGFDATDHYFYYLRNTRIIYRAVIWAGGLFPSSAEQSKFDWVNPTATYTAIGFGVACLGGYVYFWGQRTNWYLVRAAESNGAITEMSFSGNAPDNDAANTICTDGTFIYILDNTTTKLRKYSVSGTTATHVADITLSEAGAAATLAVDAVRNEIYFRSEANKNCIVKNTIAGVLIKKEFVLASTGANTLLGRVAGILYITWVDGTTYYLQPFYF
jgi:hypothetical protein